LDRRRLLQRVVRSQNNVRFSDFINLLAGFGFELDRRRGSHMVFVHPQVREYLNIQERRGEAKPYQIREFLRRVETYNLTLED
jgi:predicted RNA binding protein YcfA (HicA-like mRNA interferase family)